MNIALIFSGEPRSLALTSSSHTEIVTRLRRSHRVDVYVHGWAGADIAAQEFSKLNPKRLLLDAPPIISASHVVPDGLLKVPLDRQRALNMASMWLSVKRGYDLAQYEPVIYDAFIRTRPDALWDIPLELERFSRTRRNRFPRRAAAIMRPSDVAFIATPESAESIFKIYDQIPGWAENAADYPSVVPEYLLGRQLDNWGIDWDPFGSEICLVRQGGKAFWISQDNGSHSFGAGRRTDSVDGDALENMTNLSRETRVSIDVQTNVHVDVSDPFAISALQRFEIVTQGARGNLETILKAVPRSRLQAIYLGGMLISAVRHSRTTHSRRIVCFDVTTAVLTHPINASRAVVSTGGWIAHRLFTRIRIARRLKLPFRVMIRSSLRSTS